MTAVKKASKKLICDNRKARHEYHFLELYEAGIELKGTEVKSLRAGRANLQDAHCRVENGELLMVNMHISPYEMGNRFNHQPKRPRRLLLHKAEIRRIYARVREKGLTVIPVRMYFSGQRAKAEIALAQGKKLYDKREDMIAKTAKREMERHIKESGRE
ncbi:MAG: SsrA-binding protein SmpB [Clostridiales bacterium]|nr:SsrA-binding protein SmpB [Clostridiales bacterium]